MIFIIFKIKCIGSNNFVIASVFALLNILFQLLKLEHLALYWNSERSSDHDKKEEWLVCICFVVAMAFFLNLFICVLINCKKKYFFKGFSRSQIATSLHQPKAIKYSKLQKKGL